MIKRIRAVFLGCCIAAGSGSAIHAAISEISVNDSLPSFKSTVVVSNSEIKADLLIKNDVSATIREELANIQIGHIPHPLGELVIARPELLKKLGNIANSINIPEKITIRRLGTILKGSEVGERIKEICSQQISGDLNIDLSRIPTNVVLPGNIVDWAINTSSDNNLGMKLFVLTAQTDGGPFRQLIQVKVSRMIEAAQVVRLAKPGEEINQNMIRPHKMEVKSDLSNAPLTYAEALGKNLGRFKSAGTVLRSSDVSEKNLMTGKSEPEARKAPISIATAKSHDNWIIKPGENVNFHFNSGTLSMMIPAKAVQGGQAGDEITLINLQNKRRIRGIITEKGKVEYAQK